MSFQIKFNSAFICSLMCLILFSCKKEFDTPPVTEANDGARVSIAQIKARYSTNISYRFVSDSNLYCVVTADEVSGNLYKDIYVRDASGALHVKLKESGGLYIGDSIRINLKGCTLNEYNRLIQLDSVDTGKSIVKLASGLNPKPLVMTIAQINANTAATNSVQSKLIRIENIEFIEADRNKTYADAAGLQSKNLTITSCSGQTLVIRTSGYSNFASQFSPSGNGYLTAIISQYGDKAGDMQLILRSSTEINMGGALCTATTAPTQTFVLGNPVASINENFSSQTSTNNPIVLNGWINTDEKGTRTWYADVNAGNYRAKATSYLAGDAENKIWLISPPINASATPTLSFKSAMAYAVSGHPNPFTVWISKSFNGTNLTAANTWTAITSGTIAPLTGTNFNWVSSGTINLSTYLPAGYTSTYFIGFKYYGNKTSGYTTNYYVDDILIQ